jgi:hypothetical protein
MHPNAVLPVILGGELGITSVIVLASETLTSIFREVPVGVGRTIGIKSFVIFTLTAVLCSKMPVNIDWAETNLVIWIGNRFPSGVKATLVAHGNISTGF